MAGKELVVFDLDGTLTKSKSALDREMSRYLAELLKQKYVAVVSGCSFDQYGKQLLTNLRVPTKLLGKLFLFPTCSSAMYQYRNGWKKVYEEKFSRAEEQRIMAGFRRALEDIGYRHPKKTYSEVFENRGSQITFSALGQDAPLRLKQIWDPKRAKRLRMRRAMERYMDGFEIHIGGTTSIDVTKKGLTKTRCIYELQKRLRIPKGKMLFVGDALFKGGNDWVMRQTGIDCVQVSGSEETKKVITTLLSAECPKQDR